MVFHESAGPLGHPRPGDGERLGERERLDGGEHAAAERSMPPAVILAAGAGSRLRQGADGPPKPLTPLLGLTLVERTIRSCCAAGVREFIVIVGHRKDELTPYLRSLADDLGVRLRVAECDDWELGQRRLRARQRAPCARRVLPADGRSHLRAAVPARSRGPRQRLPAVRAGRGSRHRDRARRARGDEGAAGGRKDLGDQQATGGLRWRGHRRLPVPALAVRRAARFRRGGRAHAGAPPCSGWPSKGQVSWTPADGLFWQDIDTPEDLDIARSYLLTGNRATPGLVTA